jgi:hypothetical protein
MAGFCITGAAPDEGAAAVLNLATSPELSGVSGKYFDVARERKGVAATQDEALQDQLWATSTALL